MTFRAKIVNAYLVFCFAALLLAGCVSTAHRPAGTARGSGAASVLMQSSFQDCELRAFVAWDAARNAILFHETESQLLADPNVGAFQVALYGDLFNRIEHQDMRDYNGFAAEHFIDCARRASVPIPTNEQQIATCLGRLDIVMFLRARMLSGVPEQDANMAAKGELPSRALYSDALIDELTPKTYTTKSAGDFFDLRRSVFESCILP